MTLSEWHKNGLFRQRWREIMSDPAFQAGLSVVDSCSPARVSPYAPATRSGDERMGEVAGYQRALDNLSNLAYEPEQMAKIKETYGSIDPKTKKPIQD